MYRYLTSHHPQLCHGSHTSLSLPPCPLALQGTSSCLKAHPEGHCLASLSASTSSHTVNGGETLLFTVFVLANTSCSTYSIEVHVDNGVYLECYNESVSEKSEKYGCE
jgi:hypothetical protein